MKREYQIILVLAVLLFLVCNVVSCLSGLTVGGLWAGARQRMEWRMNRRLEPTVEPDESLPQGRAPIVALVSQVAAGSPAEQAGLQVGDRILSLDGEPFYMGDDLQSRLSLYKSGDRIELTVLRNGKIRQARITLGHNPDDRTRPYLGIIYRMAPAD